MRNETRGAEKLDGTNRHATGGKGEGADIRVVMTENDLNLKDAALIHASLWAWDGGRPAEEVVVGRGEADGAEVFFLEVGDLSVYALEGGLYRSSDEPTSNRVRRGCSRLKGWAGPWVVGRERLTRAGVWLTVTDASRRARRRDAGETPVPRERNVASQVERRDADRDEAHVSDSDRHSPSWTVAGYVLSLLPRHAHVSQFSLANPGSIQPPLLFPVNTQ